MAKESKKIQKKETRPSEAELKKKTEKVEIKTVGTMCGKDCMIHGNLKARGKVFGGIVTKKFHKRVAIEFGGTVYIRKYERYAKSRTKIHARLPDCMKDKINIGDLVRVKECRPLSKIIHSVVIEKIKDAGGEKK